MNGFTLTRSIKASPDRVWAAFTNADEYAAWVWPAEWNPKCTIDLRVGGEFHVSSEARGLSIQGTYREIEPITRLVINWTRSNRSGDTLLTITIEPADDGSTLTLTHENFPDEASLADHENGWTDCLSRLPGYLS
jgi:uncharacterized protein YndB with AHSA1/START domain